MEGSGQYRSCSKAIRIECGSFQVFMTTHHGLEPSSSVSCLPIAALFPAVFDGATKCKTLRDQHNLAGRMFVSLLGHMCSALTALFGLAGKSVAAGTFSLDCRRGKAGHDMASTSRLACLGTQAVRRYMACIRVMHQCICQHSSHWHNQVSWTSA